MSFAMEAIGSALGRKTVDGKLMVSGTIFCCCSSCLLCSRRGNQPRESSAAVVLPESQIKSGLRVATFLRSIDGRGPGIGSINTNPGSGRNLSSC